MRAVEDGSNEARDAAARFVRKAVPRVIASDVTRALKRRRLTKDDVIANHARPKIAIEVLKSESAYELPLARRCCVIWKFQVFDALFVCVIACRCDATSLKRSMI